MTNPTPTWRRPGSPSALRRGFTLVEMMVVMGIIAMILGLSVPVFAVLSQAGSIRGAIDVTQGVFMKYREKAATTGKPVFVVFEHWRNPPQFAAWYVEKAPDIADPNNEIMTFQRDPGDHVYPREAYIDENWQNSLADYSGITAGTPYEEELKALCEDSAAQYEFLSQGFNTPERKALIFVMLPQGGAMMIGKQNVPSWVLDANPPSNGDIILSNEDSRVFIDINPLTGKVRSAQAFSAQ